jgi:archaetidylinositol phosphate synthase
MFERMRGIWTKAIEPLVLKMGNLDPSILTWASLILALGAFWLISGATLDNNGAILIGVSVLLILLAGVLDALDGALARHQGVAGPYGDFLDHTIDRVVDVGLLIAIGMNSTFVSDPSSGAVAAVLTLFGSYMGTQAQSVGLDRIYGGFGRADRMVLTVACLVAASWQAYSGGAGIDLSDTGYASWVMLGNSNLNGMTVTLAISAWGGVYTFLSRFVSTRNQLLR